MARGPHDDEIEDKDSGTDHARRRLDEFLKKRDPNYKPEDDKDEPGGDAPRKPPLKTPNT
jgi:hypothetical protein